MAFDEPVENQSGSQVSLGGASPERDQDDVVERGQRLLAHQSDADGQIYRARRISLRRTGPSRLSKVDRLEHLQQFKPMALVVGQRIPP